MSYSVCSVRAGETPGVLDNGHSDGLWAFGALGDVELHALIVVKRAITTRLNLRMMNEHILRVAVWSNKAEALIAVEPFDGSL
jgi:hypothetical protein